jgi:hypothetical protein
MPNHFYVSIHIKKKLSHSNTTSRAQSLNPYITKQTIHKIFKRYFDVVIAIAFVHGKQKFPHKIWWNEVKKM